MLLKYDPPFLNSINEFLNLDKDGIYIDCTFGCGLHSRKILSYLSDKGRLISFDCDPESINIAKKIEDKRLTIIHSNFSFLKENIENRFLSGKINGILFDLGVSSLQLDNPIRGFSYSKDGLLDMRMNQNIGITASSWLNKATEYDIRYVLRKFGEEIYAKKIAKKIIFFRKLNYLKRTLDLSKLVNSVIKSKKYFKNKSARTFQAIRIYINDELNSLINGLNAAYSILSKKGRLVVISFHSLEDRIVKNFINNKSNVRSFLLPDIPLTDKEINILYPYKMINLGKFKPDLNSIKLNPRIRSAILRVAEKK